MKITKCSTIINSKGAKVKHPSFGAGKSVVIPKNIGKKLINMHIKFNSPQQRMVIGSTALLLQPFVELTNKNTDKRTKETAASRCMARAIVGTVSGVAVREGCIQLGKHLTQKGKIFHINTLKKASKVRADNYAKSIGTLLACGALVITNFGFDVPLISKFSSLINEKVFGNKPATKNKEAKNEAS